MRLAVVLTSVLLCAGAAHGQDIPYRDDRSGPVALVESLYNAVNRREFARAYAYFAEPPAASVEAYAEGYADTSEVTLVTGSPSEEGAAGSVYYTLPVAIAARGADDAVQVFAGCYTLRMANPATQADAFEPMTIHDATLEPVERPLEEALPTRCPGGPELPSHDGALEKAKTMFRADFADQCHSVDVPSLMEPETYDLRFRYAFETADDPERMARLFRFFCTSGAYNESHVHYLASDDGEMGQVQFADPELDIRYVREGDDTQVEAVSITGYAARARITNSSFDPETMVMSEHSLWRGLGDAASDSRWLFRAGSFVLVHYEVDASYDGDYTPETLVDYESAP